MGLTSIGCDECKCNVPLLIPSSDSLKKQFCLIISFAAGACSACLFVAVLLFTPSMHFICRLRCRSSPHREAHAPPFLSTICGAPSSGHPQHLWLTILQAIAGYAYLNLATSFCMRHARTLFAPLLCREAPLSSSPPAAGTARSCASPSRRRLRRRQPSKQRGGGDRHARGGRQEATRLLPLGFKSAQW